MQKLIEEIAQIGVVPVIAVDDVEKAVPLARALIAGGIPCAEITFRTPQAEESIRRIARAMPQVLLGAGTVLTPGQADRALAAGARFAVSPGFNPRVVDHCLDIGLPIIPGCSTPSDMEQAIQRGLGAVKFFPAQQSGGLAYIRAVAAPYSMLQFMPTGGIGPGNLGEYLAFDRVFACGGSWMAPPQLVAQGQFDEIQRLCAQAVDIAKKARQAARA